MEDVVTSLLFVLVHVPGTNDCLSFVIFGL
jgi:hypothetical protein